jgi:hypothetical protein
MSDFKIDIDSPYPIPTRESFNTPKHIVPYAAEPIKVRHYGRNIQLMINGIAKATDSEIKEKSLLLLANHMKKLYVTWNKETISDELIFRDIEILSGGKVKIPENVKLSQAYNLNTCNTTPAPAKTSSSSNSKKIKKKK